MMESTLPASSKWIWAHTAPRADEYAEFYTPFCYRSGAVSLSISADSAYAVYLNGDLVAFGQYPDYPHDKVYDTVDLTAYCREGENHLAIVVWYYGMPNMSYYLGNAALRFALLCDGAILAESGPRIASRISPTYASHREKIITGQLGFSFFYDATREDAWMCGGGDGFSPSVTVRQRLPLRPRPCQRLVLEPPRVGKQIQSLSTCEQIFDLGTNTVGFLRIAVTSPVAQTLLVSYGEHLADGCVRRRIAARDFSVEVRVRAGDTVYLNPFRRLGGRYLQLKAESALTACTVALCPTTYPLTERPRPTLTEEQEDIYRICVNTLRLCMHEHYEDCPWREQALYCMDSRNQMLCGYYAFGEHVFPRANLALIAKDHRPDGLLSICYPTSRKKCIPSFSLHYFTACAEYLRYTGDAAFLREIYPKLESILSVFLMRKQASNGLLLPFDGADMWNFYEWQTGLDGHTSPDDDTPDLLLQTMLSLALLRMAEISDALGIENTYAAEAHTLNEAIREAFYSEEKGLFLDRSTVQTYSVLGNSLAILCGAADGLDARAICARMIDDRSLTHISLSMQCFFFDALLATDREGYRAYILDRIAATYRPMVACGLGTVFETEAGERDFGGAGSLCHGWSAMPIYYYHILG